MTREEEINNASYAYWVNNYANIEFVDEEEKELHTQDIQESFINGAEWADAHNEGLNMHIKYLKEELIDKACEWLYDHLYTRRDEQSSANHFVCTKQEMLTQTEFIEQFRKAMRGGSSEKPNNCEKGGEE